MLTASWLGIVGGAAEAIHGMEIRHRVKAPIRRGVEQQECGATSAAELRVELR
jgi:hypothetical protein